MKIIPNFYDYYLTEKSIRNYLSEGDEQDQEDLEMESPEELDPSTEEEEDGEPEGLDLEDSDDLADGDFGQDSGYDDGFGQEEKSDSKFNNMNKVEIYASYNELVKMVSRNTGLRVEGAFDKEMGITFNSSIHNTAYWKLIRKDNLVSTYILTAMIDPEKLIEKLKPREEEAEEESVEEQEEMGGEEEMQPEAEGEMAEDPAAMEEEPSIEGEGDLEIEIYVIKTKEKKTLKANVDVISEYINDIEEKERDKNFKKLEKERNSDDKSVKDKKYFI